MMEGIEIALDDLAASLRDHRAEIALGGRIDFSGLDSRVEDLSRDLLQAKPESQRFLPRLHDLMSELDTLHADLKNQAGRG